MATPPTSDEEIKIHELAFDVETTQKSTYPLKKNGKPFGAWPFCAENYVVLEAVATKGARSSSLAGALFWDTKWMTEGIYQGMFYTQNGKFDLHYFRRTYGEERYKDVVSHALWDIQIAEYILSGHQAKSISLDDLTAKYLPGVEPKDPVISAMFEEGKGADEIADTLLKPYAEADVRKTFDIAKKQQERASPKEFRLILQMGEALKACAEMEWNGFAINKDLLSRYEIALRLSRDSLAHGIVHTLAAYYQVPEEAININSNHLWSLYIFGGEYEFEWRVPCGFFQTGARAGETRYRIIKKLHKDPFGIEGVPKEETATKGVYVIDEDVLKAGGLKNSCVGAFAEYKLQNKLLNTYVENIKANTEASLDGRLHHNLNQTTADTGRLSCSNPNMQNMPTDADKLRSCFVSRWGADGVLIAADYTALELVGFAFVNHDPQMIYDLSNGIDPHTETGKAVYGLTYKMSESERRDIKGINFGTIYGGGAHTISKQSGIDKVLVGKVARAFKQRYKVGFKVAEGRTPLSVIVSPTGRKYVTNGKYTKGMNYPVQGFSTADLVPTVQGVMWRRLYVDNVYGLRENCLTINQEHDKLLFDCKLSHLGAALKLIKTTMESAPTIMKDTYGIDMPTGTPVKITVGFNLAEMTLVEKGDFGYLWEGDEYLYQS